MSNMKIDRLAWILSCRGYKSGLIPCAYVARLIPRVHRDERGSISIVSVMALMMFTVLLGMVVNVGRHVDDKVKQQNASDAATLSGGVVLARGMNSLAFSNHLLCDVFALTAFMREGRDRNAEALTTDVLAAWSTVAPMFEKAPFPKFQGLGSGLPPKIEAEKKMIKTYSEFAASVSKTLLPTLEGILEQHLIPRFQQAIVQTIPGVAQQTVGEVARRHGLKPDQEMKTRGQTYAVLWRLAPQYLQPAAQSDESDALARTLPAVDPNGKWKNTLIGIDPAYAPQYSQTAISERKQLTESYLNQWNSDVDGLFLGMKVGLFLNYAKLSQFQGLWDVFTKGQLCKLLNEEYPDSNLPFQIRRNGLETPDQMIAEIMGSGGPQQGIPNLPDWRRAKSYLESSFRFGGVAYRKPLREMFGKLFLNQQSSDAITFSEVSLFIPEPRWVRDGSIDLWGRENWPRSWSLLTQNWTAQLVPATAEGFAQILQSSPGDLAPGTNVLSLGSSGDSKDIRSVNTH